MQTQFGKTHKVVKYNGFQIVECGSYESYGWRVFQDNSYIANIDNEEAGRRLIDKINEAREVAASLSNLDRSVCVVAAKPIVGGELWYGVQFHEREFAERFKFVWQEVKLGAAMYPEFEKWHIAYIV